MMSIEKYSSRWDNAGMTASVLCAIHCAIVPLLITFLPLAGLGFLANPWIEWSMIMLALFIGSYAIGLSYLKVHRKILPVIFLIAGFMVIIGGHVFTHGWREAIVVPTGGLMIAVSHFINYRYSTICAIPALPFKLTHKHSHEPAPEITVE